MTEHANLPVTTDESRYNSKGITAVYRHHQVFLSHPVGNSQHRGQKRGGCGDQGLESHGTVVKVSRGGYLAWTGEARPLWRGSSSLGTCLTGLLQFQGLPDFVRTQVTVRHVVE